jgi:hypothetical protein
MDILEKLSEHKNNVYILEPLLTIHYNNIVKKLLHIKEEKACQKCKKLFTPKRNKHYLCNECWGNEKGV